MGDLLSQKLPTNGMDPKEKKPAAWRRTRRSSSPFGGGKDQPESADFTSAFGFLLQL